ncbi:hypothetical protein Sjap_018939 [Stephania japonica]|uniref:Uncharacterized protein n=1 Tax=Stephania japonica TaxID=461633 RepID=A0AAP0HZ21_9MAGN
MSGEDKYRTPSLLSPLCNVCRFKGVVSTTPIIDETVVVTYLIFKDRFIDTGLNRGDGSGDSNGGDDSGDSDGGNNDVGNEGYTNSSPTRCTVPRVRHASVGVRVWSRLDMLSRGIRIYKLNGASLHRAADVTCTAGLASGGRRKQDNLKKFGVVTRWLAH